MYGKSLSSKVLLLMVWISLYREKGNKFKGKCYNITECKEYAKNPLLKLARLLSIMY